jgi:hypothetical protein
LKCISSYFIKEMNVKKEGTFVLSLQVVLLLLFNEEKDAFFGTVIVVNVFQTILNAFVLI